MNKFKLTLLASLVCAVSSVYAADQPQNFTGNVTVDGNAVQISDFTKIDLNGKSVILGGKNYGLVVQNDGTSASISGDSISISGNTAGLFASQKSIVNIGTSSTETLNIIGGTSTAVFALPSSQVNLEAKNINIESQGDFALHAQNNTQTPEAPEGATHLTLKAENISIKGKNLGISAFSNSTIDLIGNLTVVAQNAIDTRGNSTININKDGKYTVKLEGDIVFETPGPINNSGDVVNSYLTVNLTNPDSYWVGSVYKDSFEGISETSDKVKDFRLNISNGASWDVKSTETSEYTGQKTSTDGIVTSWTQNVRPLAVNYLTLNDGIINITEGADQVVQVENLSGTGGTINTVATTDGTTVSAGQLQAASVEGTPHFTVNALGINSDDITNQQKALESLYASALNLGDNSEATATLNIAEGNVAGALTAETSADGVSVQEAQNTVNASLIDIASSNYLFFRSQINDVSARMGDLRSMPKTAGAWVRYYGGQNKYSDRGQKEKYNTIQIGGDAFINNNFYLGGTFSYTDGDGTLKNGSTDDKNYNFGIYGGWIGEKGQFVDVIIKRHRVETDFDLYNANGLSSGSYHNWGTTASVEAGWRLQCPNTGFYAEPQVELQFGRLDSVNYRTGKGVKVEQDGIDSIIGRAGVAVGLTFPENKGTAYAKASVLHDWKGEVKSTFSANGVERTYKDDLGGTWGEFAVGATYNPTKNVSAYTQVKTSTGSPVRNPWQVSVGLRYNF